MTRWQVSEGTNRQNLVEWRGDRMAGGWRGWLGKILWSGGVTEWQVSVGGVRDICTKLCGVEG